TGTSLSQRDPDPTPRPGGTPVLRRRSVPPTPPGVLHAHRATREEGTPHDPIPTAYLRDAPRPRHPPRRRPVAAATAAGGPADQPAGVGAAVDRPDHGGGRLQPAGEE